jgi:hypothetical protein
MVLLLSITEAGVANVIIAEPVTSHFPSRLYPAWEFNATLVIVSDKSVVWLDYPTVAEHLEIPVGKVRRLVQDRALLARRIDGVWKVPEAMLQDKVISELRGAATVLIDGGFTDDEALDWLLRPHDQLGSTPLEALQDGRAKQVRRIAQSLAL